jgi:clan AA aspartic protease (TIGR02281 family)
MRTLLLFISMLCVTSWGNSQTVIKMKREGGVSVIPCTVNGLRLSFIFDTGAGEVSISMTEASFMLKNDYLSPDDIKGTQKYLDANGNISEGIKLILKEVEISGLKLYNVEATIVKNLKAPLLLGQSAINKLGKIQLDLQSNTLTILDGKRSYDFSEENINPKPNFMIGQIYDGGFIFYIDGTGTHGLITADKHIWVTSERAVGNWGEALNACRTLGNGWRLPSKDELNLMRISKEVLSNIQLDGVYWSSTECNNNSAWAIDFTDGEQTCWEKRFNCGVRAVKTF